MNQTELLQGDPVRITSGAYAGAEGVVADIQPECSAVVVHTKSGNAYGYKEGISKLVKPMPVNKPVIRKR